MDVQFIHGDILDEHADGLVCSGNIYLNMSGGVNGALLARGGEPLQKQLHQYLYENQLKFVEPGFVMEIGPQPFDFQSIVYCVAIDCWYESTIALTQETLTNALTILQGKACKTINIPALATGYGKLSKTDFGKALQRTLTSKKWAFEEVHVVERDQYGLEEIQSGFDRLSD